VDLTASWMTGKPGSHSRRLSSYRWHFQCDFTSSASRILPNVPPYWAPEHTQNGRYVSGLGLTRNVLRCRNRR
jgi:hypothetical protein